MNFRLSIAGKLGAAFLSAAAIAMVLLCSLLNQALNERAGISLGELFSLMPARFMAYAIMASIPGILCIYIVVATFVRPIRRLTRMTQKIAAKKYHYRSRINRSDELGDLARALDRMARQLDRHQDQETACVEDLSGQARQFNEYLVDFEESQRKSIAAELHGTIAQTLGLGVSRVKTLIESCPDENRCRELTEARTFLENGIKEVRALMYELAPPILDNFDIDVAIEFLIEEINEKSNTRFDFTNAVGGAISLNRAVKLTFYRAVKTIVNNIVKFAQDTPKVRLELSVLENSIHLRVDVTGPRLDLKQAAIPAGDISGHQDFSERLKRLGGEFKVVPGPASANGTTMILTAPALTADTPPGDAGCL